MSDQQNPWAPPAPPAASANPYAAPRADVIPSATGEIEDAELIRHQLLKHESSIRAIGLLYLISAFFMGTGTVTGVVFAILGFVGVEGMNEMAWAWAVMGVFYGLLTYLSYYLGKGLRNLEPKAKAGVTILSIFGLLFFPMTILFLYILYLIYSEKGKRILTPEYQKIVAQTPHIRYKFSLLLVVMFILGFFILFALGIWMSI